MTELNGDTLDGTARQLMSRELIAVMQGNSATSRHAIMYRNMYKLVQDPKTTRQQLVMLWLTLWGVTIPYGSGASVMTALETAALEYIHKRKPTTNVDLDDVRALIEFLGKHCHDSAQRNRK